MKGAKLVSTCYAVTLIGSRKTSTIQDVGIRAIRV